MKQAILALLCLSLPLEAAASPVIRFSAQVESEALAEEVILLLHCVSTRAGLSWEFSGEASGSHWLAAREAKGKAQLTWHKPEGEKTAELAAGGSENACDQLEPALKTTGELAGPAAARSLEPMSASLLDTEDQAPSRAWLWAGLGAGVVAGFLFWKSRQPDHRGVEMR